jgi:hypothetical protein
MKVSQVSKFVVELTEMEVDDIIKKAVQAIIKEKFGVTTPLTTITLTYNADGSAVSEASAEQ